MYLNYRSGQAAGSRRTSVVQASRVRPGVSSQSGQQACDLTYIHINHTVRGAPYSKGQHRRVAQCHWHPPILARQVSFCPGNEAGWALSCSRKCPLWNLILAGWRPMPELLMAFQPCHPAKGTCADPIQWQQLLQPVALASNLDGAIAQTLSAGYHACSWLMLLLWGLQRPHLTGVR